MAGNKEKWQRIEIAKRRLLYTLNRLGLPYGSRSEGFEVPLSFDFKADTRKKRMLWLNMGKQEQVYTGHADGKVTLNIREADDVEREKTRISFGEAQRTVIGHFRHEIGHYFWDVLVKGKCEPECVAVFGDHNNPDYGTALEQYYENGPLPGWQTSHISAYATMHPWEDFAECF
ncbi:MAG: putative zinc-binding metallopeptidase, partial [Pseudomonadales bacterium]